MTIEQSIAIENWFRSASFEIPFMPSIEMEIDLDDFFTAKGLVPPELMIGCLPIKNIVFRRDLVVLYIYD